MIKTFLLLEALMLLLLPNYLSCESSNKYVSRKDIDLKNENPVTIKLRQASPSNSSQRELRNTSRIKNFVVVSPNDFWIVTDISSSQVFFTKNAGLAWNELQLPNAKGIFGVDFVDSQNGWLLDFDGNLWNTVDGGADWKIVSKALNKLVDDSVLLEPSQIKFVSVNTGLILDARIFITDNGGQTWRIISEIKGEPQNIFFRDSLNGWISTYFKSSLLIYQTADGGKTWHETKINSDLTDARVFFLDDDNGWFTAKDSLPFFTKDKGKTWLPFKTPIENFQVKSIFWINSQNGWLVGYTFDNPEYSDPRFGKAILFKTGDGGQFWQKVEFEDKEPFLDTIYFADSRRGWLLSRENIYQTVDGGES